MRAIKTSDYYASFSLYDIGVNKLYQLVEKAINEATTIQVADKLDSEINPMFKTQIPFFNGTIDTRQVYLKTDAIKKHILAGFFNNNAYEIYLCEYYAWEFYNKETLILSINMIMDVVTVNEFFLESKGIEWEKEDSYE